MEFDVIYYVRVLISGLRTATYILSVIPNLDVFRTVLHVVRLWAESMYYHVCFYFTRSWFILTLPGFLSSKPILEVIKIPFKVMFFTIMSITINQ